MKTETEHSREAESHLRVLAAQGRWERCARHCTAMQQRYALCCDERYLYGLDYPEVLELMELWLYWAALQDLFAAPDEESAFAAMPRTLSAFLDSDAVETQRRRAAKTYQMFRTPCAESRVP